MSGEDLDPEFFEQIVETVGVGVAVYGREGRYLYVNSAYADLFDADPDALVGTALWDVVPSFERDQFAAYWESFADGETRTDETIHEFRGVSVPVETVTTRRHIASTPYHFGTITDITERKERERALERQNERLESFAGVVSHDLRNPLNVARGYLDLLQSDVDRDELDLIESSLRQMELLVEDLLTLAREGRSIGETRPVSVTDAAGAAWQSTAAARATLETPETDVTVTADPTRLQQLLANLFRNAVEHGSRSSRSEADDAVEHGSDDVTVRVGALDRDEGFYVADDGPGIESSVEETLFEAGVSTKEAGTGFGLAIVAEVAEAHGWEVTVTESQQGGARFEFRVESPTRVNTR